MSAKKILFIESVNCTPHIETAFELAKKHLEFGDIVYFDFIGHALMYSESWSLSVKRSDVFFDNMLPENKGAALLKNYKHFHYHNYFKLKKVQRETNQINDLESIKSATRKDINIGIGVVSSLISKYRMFDLNLTNKEIREEVENGLISASQVVDFTLERINELQPNLIYIFNGRLCNVRPIYEISLKGQIEFRIHERGCSMMKYEIFESLPHDNLSWQRKILKNARNKNIEHLDNQATIFFGNKRKGQPQDWYSFTKNQQKGKLPLLDESKNIITYFQSSDDEYAEVGDFYKWDVFNNQLDAFTSLLDIVSDMSNLQLVLRMHPNMFHCDNDLMYWESIDLPENAIYVGPEEDIDSYELMEYSDLVIVAGSTMGIESVYWGKPCMSLGPSLYSELNAVFIPKAIEDMKWALDNIEKLPIGREGAIRYGAYMNTYGKDFEYYKPQTLAVGQFMGINLQKYNQYNFKFIQKKSKVHIELFIKYKSIIYRYIINNLKNIIK